MRKSHGSIHDNVSLHALAEQCAVPLLAEGRAGLSLQEFPEFWVECADMVFLVSPQALCLFPVEGQGTLLVYVNWSYDHHPRHYHVHAVLFTSDPSEYRVAHFSLSDASKVMAQAMAFFAIPNGADGAEHCQAMIKMAAEGVYRWNVYWCLPGWPTSLYLFPPTRADPAVTVLMAPAFSGGSRRCYARIVRFGESHERCTQMVMQASTLDQVIDRTLLRYRFWAFIRQWLNRAPQWESNVS